MRNAPAPLHKLAGFVFDHDPNTRLTDAFARFCGLDQDPENLPETAYHAVLRKQWPVKYPTASAAELGEILSGESARYGIKNELAQTMAADQLTTILLQMRQARALFDKAPRPGLTYIPVTRL